MLIERERSPHQTLSSSARFSAARTSSDARRCQPSQMGAVTELDTVTCPDRGPGPCSPPERLMRPPAPTPRPPSRGQDLIDGTKRDRPEPRGKSPPGYGSGLQCRLYGAMMQRC